MLKRLWLIFAQAVTVALAALFVVATLKPQWLAQDRRPDAAIAATARQIALPPAPAASVVRAGFSQAARIASPAVVSITASKAPPRAAGRAREPLFGFPGFPFGSRPRGGPQLGLGSGVIISADGVLLTNNHVVEGASDIEVQLSDGRQAQATLVGTDPETDVAVLKIALPNLPTIPLGDAASLAVGDAVLAIGNPFNVGQTVTSGIVSALGRSQLGINTFENFIQTDAAINPGNSGGALVDGKGHLVGINTAIYSRSGGSQGIGFAIPVSLARQVMEQIIATGRVSRGWLGVSARDVVHESTGAAAGAALVAVQRGGPADRAGLRPGDTVLAINGKQILDTAGLIGETAAIVPGSSAEFKILRGRETASVQVELGQRPVVRKP